MIRLRAVENDDLDFLFRLENSDDARAAGFTTAPVSRQMLWDYINSYDADIFSAKQLRLIIVDADGTRVGTIDISDFDARDRRGFVGIAIDEPFRGKGYATEALSQLCRYASETLGMHQLVAVTGVDNTASRRLFTAAGFRSNGRLRSWIRRGSSYEDALIMQKLFAH